MPLSSFQMRLWVLHRLEPDSTAYNMVTAWLHAEEADAAAIEGLIRTVLQENEILRATFRDDGVGPGIYPLPPEAVRIAVRDLRGRSEPDQEAAIRADRRAETRTPVRTVDRGADALDALSGRGYALGDTGRRASHRHGRVVADASATQDRSPYAQPPSALQYADYAAWQRTQPGPDGDSQ